MDSVPIPCDPRAHEPSAARKWGLDGRLVGLVVWLAGEIYSTLDRTVALLGAKVRGTLTRPWEPEQHADEREAVVELWDLDRARRPLHSHRTSPRMSGKYRGQAATLELTNTLRTIPEADQRLHSGNGLMPECSR